MVHFTNASGGILPAAFASENITAAASKFQLKCKLKPWKIQYESSIEFEDQNQNEFNFILYIMICESPVLHKALARPLKIHPGLLREAQCHRLWSHVMSNNKKSR